MVTSSGGLMMYARLLEESLERKARADAKRGELPFAEVLALPEGLDAMYAENFPRAFPDGAVDGRWVRSKRLVASIVVAREPLPVSLATGALGWSVQDADRAYEDTALLFPVREGRFHVLHKSVVDWLTAASSVGVGDVEAADVTLSRHLIQVLAPLVDGAVVNVTDDGDDPSLAYAVRHVVAHVGLANNAAVRSDLEDRVLGLRFIFEAAAMGRCATLVRDFGALARGHWTGRSSFVDWRRFVQHYSHLLGPTPSTAFTLAANWPDHAAPTRSFCELERERAPEVAWVFRQRFKPQELHPGLLTLVGHTRLVTCCAFSSDGMRVVTASEDKTARLWDAETGAAVATLEGHTSLVTSCAFSSDDTRVVTASHDGTARLWDAETGTTVATLEGHFYTVTSCAFSSDGTRVVTASKDMTARLWDAETGALLSILFAEQYGSLKYLAVARRKGAFDRADHIVLTATNLKRPLFFHVGSPALSAVPGK